MYPVLFHIGDVPIYSYGLMAAAGWLFGIAWFIHDAKGWGVRGGEREAWHFVYAAFAGAIVGGKLLALIAYAPSVGFRDMLRNLTTGFVYLGGVLGAWLAVTGLARLRGYRALVLGDFWAGPIAVGHALGRIGCLGAGCCHGSPTSLPWGIRFTDRRAFLSPEFLGVPLHPTQIFEAIGELLIVATLLRYFRPRLIAGELRPGITWLSYIAMYGCLRFGSDFMRGDDPDFVVGPLTASQAISLVLVAGSLWYIRRIQRGPAPQPAKPQRASR